MYTSRSYDLFWYLQVISILLEAHAENMTNEMTQNNSKFKDSVGKA